MPCCRPIVNLPHRKARNLGGEFQGACCLSDLQARVRRCWRAAMPVKPTFLSSRFPDLTLWRCLSVVGASRVRDLFEQGKEECALHHFIDEIDAVGGTARRSRRRTPTNASKRLNALLVEMDGFESNTKA